MARETVARPRRRKVGRVFKTHDHAWVVLKRKHKAHSRSRDLPCWYARWGKCVMPSPAIDYSAPPVTPAAYETDHRVPRSVDPTLAYQWGNLEASHCRCNRTHRDDRSFMNNVAPQQEWVRPSW